MNATIFAGGSRTPRSVGWELRRFAAAAYRRFGSLAVIVPTCLVASAIALAFAAHEREVQAAAWRAHAEVSKAARTSVSTVTVPSGRARLDAFEATLPASDNIADTVAAILEMANTAGVVIKRGEYRPTADAAGGFMRYRMALPVSGEPGAIVDFLRDAMAEYRTLTIESIRFVRANPSSRQVEARIQWTLLTRLPRSARAQAQVAAQRVPEFRP